MKTQPALPIIEVKKNGAKFEVHWDYQHAPETQVLRTQRDRLDGFIDGVLVALDIPSKNAVCAVALTGVVKRLEESTTIKLAKILTDLLHPLVTAEHKKQAKHANLPHVKYAAEREKRALLEAHPDPLDS